MVSSPNLSRIVALTRRRVPFLVLLLCLGVAGAMMSSTFTRAVLGRVADSPAVKAHARVAPSASDIATLPADAANTAEKTPAGLTAGDWGGIKQAYERKQRAAFAIPGGHEARNEAQQWQMRFDGRGVAVAPDHKVWNWGLELRGYGFPGHERRVTGKARVTTQDERVAYRWDATIEEWFVNEPRGLEHGFTLHARPSSEVGAGDALEVRLAVRGGLQPRVLTGGRAVSFVDATGCTALNYGGLKVWDADGRELAAHFTAAADELRLAVEERGARYPLTIDPFAQQAYLKASNTDASDWFGYSVAVSGNTVVVGAALEDSNATGVNGNGADNSASNAGAAYVFVRSGGVWSQQAYLKASNTEADDIFGVGVAISGDTIVVGAYAEDSNATGVGGNQNSNDTSNSGAAYVFTRSGNTWSQQAYLKAAVVGIDDYFGSSLALSGDTLVIGAEGEDSNATGVNGNPNNEEASYSGAAYVFVRSSGVWSQQAYLKASNTGADDAFTRVVALSGDTIVVGALGEDSNATGVNGNQSNESASDAGAAYVFTRSGVTWSQQAYLKASNTEAGDFFGLAVAISGDTIVVGARKEDSSATGSNGNQADNSRPDAGAAYVFVRNGTTWSQQAYLKASNPDPFDGFGNWVAISGDRIVVGANSEDSGSAGNQADNSVDEAGAAYVFLRSGTTWSQEAYLKAANPGAGDNFGGYAVAIDGTTIVVGAFGEDSNATGVNGNGADNSASDAGAVYTYDFVTCSALTVTPTNSTLPAGLVNSSYSVSFGATGGSGSATFAVTAGALPNGLMLSTGGILSGTPTNAGDYTFTITATDVGAACSGQRQYTLHVDPPCGVFTVTPTNGTLPGRSVNLTYSVNFGTTGGSGTATFAVTAGALPNGLVLSTAGALSGTPTTPGDYTFTITATETGGGACSGQRQYTLRIYPPCSLITVGPSSLPDATVNTFYTQTITATGGNGPYTFSFSYNSAPAGMMLNSNTGVFSGTPTASGTFEFVIRATDAGGCTGERVYEFAIKPQGLQYYPLAQPVRLLDTRPDPFTSCIAASAPLGNASNTTLQAVSGCTGIPATAKAIVGNATVVNFQSDGGYITLYPANAAVPNASNLNYTASQIVPNSFTVGLDATGQFNVYASGATNFIIDITGYYAPPGTGGLYFHPLDAPVRLLDTRDDPSFPSCVAASAPLGSNATTTLPALSACTGIPASAKAIVGNATVVNFQSSGGYITLYPSGTAPNASNLNYTANQIVPNAFTVGLDGSGQFKVYASGATNFIVDVTGYYDDNPTGGLLFYPLNKPGRWLDTRPDPFVSCEGRSTPLTSGETFFLPAELLCDSEVVPMSAQAVVGNATIVSSQMQEGFLTLWPEGERPNASNLNYVAGQIVPNAFVVKLSTGGAFLIYASGATDLIIDLSGYFAP